MGRMGAGLLILLSLGIGGGSLVLFTYFLIFGNPFAFTIVQTEASRLGWDAALCFAFFLQHSGMVRRGWKDRVARNVPSDYQPLLYSIASGGVLFALVVLWQPTGHVLFAFHGLLLVVPASLVLLAVFGFAWGVRALGEFDPFGTAPLQAVLRGKPKPSPGFVVRGPYRYVRHPLYLAMLLLIWSVPRLSTDRLLFNLLWTAWIVVGTKLEERDLVAGLGHIYRGYQSSVPMLLPSRRSFAGKTRLTTRTPPPNSHTWVG